MVGGGNAKNISTVETQAESAKSVNASLTLRHPGNSSFTQGLVFTVEIEFSDETNAVWNTTIDASPSVSLSFNGTIRDRVGRGPTALSPDGDMDGVFAVTIEGGFKRRR